MSSGEAAGQIVGAVEVAGVATPTNQLDTSIGQVVLCCLIVGLLLGLLMRFVRWHRPITSELAVFYIGASIMGALFAIRWGLQIATGREYLRQETLPYIIIDLAICVAIWAGKLTADKIICLLDQHNGSAGRAEQHATDRREARGTEGKKSES